MTNITKPIQQEDAIRCIVDYLIFKQESRFSTYGYDLYIPRVMDKWYQENRSSLTNDKGRSEIYYPIISPYFYNAAWELCRLGVLRPGVIQYGRQSTDDGSAGNGYSITPFGEQWLKESDKNIFVPTEPGRFSEMIIPYTSLFGDGFHERSNQAIRCYGAHTYLACCVMCGAAAESILLHLAIKKMGSEKDALDTYRKANGRKSLENMLVGELKGSVKSEFEATFSLLKYWRDEAAHGRDSKIAENEAYTSLALLLRCALFAKNNYNLLTAPT